MRAVQLAPWGMAAVLWLPIAVAGGLGFAPLSFLMVLFVLFHGRENRLRVYMIALGAAFGFAILSSLWSPFDAPPIVFDLEKSKFAIRATALRIGLVAVIAALIIGAALKMSPDRAVTVSRWFLIVFFLHIVMMIGYALFTEEILDAFLPILEDRGEGYQDIGRNAVIYSATAVLLMAIIRSGRMGLKGAMAHLAVFVLALFSMVLEVMNDNVAGVAAIGAGYVLIYLIDFWGAVFWRFIGGATAIYILTTPLWVSGLIALIGDKKSELPASAWWRVESWSYTLEEIISKKPWTGWGLDALRTFRETFPDGRWEGQLMMPNHPHNMFLHIWAETGLVGATLTAAACFLFAWRLSNATGVTREGQLLAAGLWGVVLTICSFSFSLWNEWWWAFIGLSAAIIVVFDRASPSFGRVEEMAT